MNTEADALFSRTQQGVLGLLFGKPDQRFYANEIIRRVGMGRGTVRRELDRLARAGLVKLVQEGNQHHYQANSDCPIYAELVGIARKTFALADVVREALAPLGEKLKWAFVYGSMAKGGDTQESDIDLMLIGQDLAYTSVIELLQPLEESVTRRINPTIYSVHEFDSKLKERNSFLERVVSSPIINVKGSKNELGKSGED
ncbi:MAG: helix-turn-helix domain-containing protein [Pseudomonadales bacterium]|jgi:predicted nucleotidyltransferase|nr:helix-turn-helix domain-containing protein [Pseudomonadales bacterium]